MVSKILNLKYEKLKVRNKSYNTKIKTAERKFRECLEETNDIEVISKQLSFVYSKLDKAMKIGAIHVNKNRRKKSRLASLLVTKIAKVKIQKNELKL